MSGANPAIPQAATETPILIAEEVGRLLESDASPAERLDRVISYMKRAMRADCATLLRHHAKTGDLFLEGTDGLSAEMKGTFIVNRREGLNGLVVRTNRPLAVRDGPSHPTYRYVPALMEEAFHSFLGVPVMSGKRVLGVLSIQTISPRDFSREEIALLKTIAAQIGPTATEVFGPLNRKGRDPATETQSTDGARAIRGRALSAGCFVGAPRPVGRGLRLETVFTPPSRGEQVEREALRAAVDRVREEIRKDAQGIVGSEGFAVLMAHRVVLDDEQLPAEMGRRIHDGASAAEAVRSECLKWAQLLEGHADATFAARASDFRDVANRLLRALGIETQTHGLGEKKIVALARTILPGDILRLGANRLGALVLADQGIFSHLAILCRSFGIPAVQIEPENLDALGHARELLVDGTEGSILIDPTTEATESHRRRAAEIILLPEGGPADLSGPTTTADGEPIAIGLNAGLENDFDRIDAFGPDEIALYRTEIPFMSATEMPDLEEQIDCYHRALTLAGGRRVTFRTFDFGGDKPPPAMRLDPEENPMMGKRSTRLLLDCEDILHTQLEALLRVSVEGPTAILIPMISTAEEFNLVLDEINSVKNDLEDRGVAFDRRVPVGVMIEVPSAMFQIEELSATADFFSVGSNDLVQYLMAADRGNPSVSRFYQWRHPAVMAALERLIRHCREREREVTICGEMANDPWAAMVLVGMGCRRLSLDRHSIHSIKWTLRQTTVEMLRKLADSVIHATSSTDALERLWAALREIRRENQPLGQALRSSLERLSRQTM
jgi:phosphotransferase system enzyme I (PtsP)